MSNRHKSSTISFGVNASVIALVAFLCGVLYFFGTAMSGDKQLTKSVAGAEIIDTRDSPK